MKPEPRIFNPNEQKRRSTLSPAVQSGDAEIAISVFPGDTEGLERITLLEESYVVAMRRDHPAANRFDLDAWLSWPHILVSGRGELRTPLDAQLAAKGRTRRVGVVVPSFQLVLPLLTGTDLMAMLLRHGFDLHRHKDLISLALYARRGSKTATFFAIGILS